LLATFAEGKVQGDGKLTGQVPLVISNGGVTFGEGAIGALGSGELKIVDASLTEPIAAAAQQGVGGLRRSR
jgi:hypothetical protein